MKKTLRKLPFMSVAVICYNGEHTIARTIRSLLDQDYPMQKYEIIVVDDGSTDNTPAVVRKFRKKVRYVCLKKNQGISGARNAGLKVAKGDVYVTFDDDCLADRTWLSNLAKGYKHEDVAGVGGVVVEPKPLKGLVRKYINATGAGAPAEISTHSNKASVVRRLGRYLKGMLSVPSKPTKKIVRVEELYGANGSYPMDVLRAVGGWDREMSGIEDRDLSKRIHEKFPERAFYAVTAARMVHDPHMSLWQYLKRPYRRGPQNLKFHKRYGILPPLFPFPFATLLLLTYAGFLAPLHCLTVLVVAPQLFYPRWIRRLARTGGPVNILFPYIQMAEEIMVIAGLARGYMQDPAAIFPRLSKWLRLSLFINTAAIATWMHFVLQPGGFGVRKTLLSTAFLLTMPGYLLLRSVVGYSRKLSFSRIATYTAGLSVISLMLIGLLLNEMLFYGFHVTKPLEPRPLAYAIGAVSFVLAVIAARRKPLDRKLPRLRRATVRRYWEFTLAAISLPLLAAGGAITLNNGGSDMLALIAMGGAAALFLLLLWLHSKRAQRLYPAALFSICLTVLLGTSLRGWNITGHDIMQEYQVFELTLRHAAWHMSYYQDAYNACLSITILPTIFRQLTGLTDPFVYKFIFQLFFAMIAPALYNTMRAYVGRKTAFLATFIFIAFPAFLTDITMLNRQETAFFCFVLALQASLDTSLRRSGKLLALIFLGGVVLSHYSTSYVASGILLITLLLGFGWRILAKLFRKPAGKNFTIFPASYILAMVIMVVTWGSLVTQTSGNISATLSGIFTGGLPAIFDSNNHQGSKTGAVNSDEGAVQAYLQLQQDIRTLAPADYYADAGNYNSTVQARSDAVDPEQSWFARYVSASEVYKAYDKLKGIYGLIIEGLIGLGIILLLLVRRYREKVNGQYRLLILASLGIIGVQVVLPASLINYGLLRVIQQGLIVLAIPIILACYWMLGIVRMPRLWQQRTIGVVLVGFFLILTGFLPAVTGGYKPSLAFSNRGFYYEAYYTHASEIAGDQWLATQTPKGSQVYSDEFARRKMISYAGIFAQPTLAPTAVPIDSYVYLSAGNTARGVVSAYYQGNLIYYTVPALFLQTHKNVLYNSGQVVIYK
ncbi:MAG TPA: glycosyltransferase [Candidatus Saccharimonadales bacterium]|nr:glycosyltransferase [Candidatus Saccharimonadales bacterium]